MNEEKICCISQLKSFLRFPSISADSSKKEAVKACADWLYNHLKAMGLQTVEIHRTKLHPIIYAEHTSHPSYKTVLFYGHYDVQPVDPLSEWKHPPFEPLIKGDYIYARGASDDKGQMFVHIKAIERLLSENGSLPVNIKCLFEGEEEIGSPHLEDFIKAHRSKLQCDAAVVSDTKMLSENQPAITYSLRGSLNAELVIRRAGKDLHSGTFGGIVHNPADVISRIVAGIHDAQHKVMIPGFYDGVQATDQEERIFMKRNGPSDEMLLQDAGTTAWWGEKGYNHYERTTIRPSVTVSGLSCGYQGEGVKNVIPAQASMKINMRLVPDQRPQTIAENFSLFIQKRLPAGYTHQLKFSSMVDPIEVSRNDPYLRAAAKAYRKVFSHQPVFLRSGGTIPVVNLFEKILRVPTLLMGFALATDDMHAPNEKFFLPNFFKAIQTSILFMQHVNHLTKRAKQYATPYH